MAEGEELLLNKVLGIDVNERRRTGGGRGKRFQGWGKKRTPTWGVLRISLLNQGDLRGKLQRTPMQKWRGLEGLANTGADLEGGE